MTKENKKKSKELKIPVKELKEEETTKILETYFMEGFMGYAARILSPKYIF